MTKRKLDELNLLDDFLFGSMVTYPEIGEAFSRELLKIIFQREFGKLNITPQKVYYGSGTEQHGARLDVCIEEDKMSLEVGEAESIYDIEPEKKYGIRNIRVLPKRVRFYHAKIDAGSLKAGQKYDSLKNVYIIMILPYDPFGRNRMVYTIQNGCCEVPDMPYEDGAKTIFLYTRGTEGNPPEELIQLLRYMEDTKEENAKNKALERIHQMVETVKRDEEVTLQYMKIFEKEEMLIEMGREEGIAQGREEGIAQGREEGIAQGREEGIAQERKHTEAVLRELERLKEELKKLKSED